MRDRPAPASPLYPKIRFAFTDRRHRAGEISSAPAVLRTDRAAYGTRLTVDPLCQDFQQSDSCRGHAAGLVIWARFGCRMLRAHDPLSP